MKIRAKIGAGAGATGIRGPGRDQEAGLLQLGGSRSELIDSGAHRSAESVVAKDPVASTATAKGMVTPPIKNLAAKPAGGIAVPNRHAEAALHSHPEER